MALNAREALRTRVAARTAELRTAVSSVEPAFGRGVNAEVAHAFACAADVTALANRLGRLVGPKELMLPDDGLGTRRRASELNRPLAPHAQHTDNHPRSDRDFGRIRNWVRAPLGGAGRDRLS